MPTKTELAKIHIGAKEVGLSSGEYRNLLRDRFGVDSSKDLGRAQVAELLAHFRRLGWRPIASRRRSGGSNTYKNIGGPYARQKRYILALWTALGYELPALDTRCAKQFKIDRFEWLRDTHAIGVLITDLQARCRRAEIDPSPDGRGK